MRKRQLFVIKIICSICFIFLAILGFSKETYYQIKIDNPTEKFVDLIYAGQNIGDLPRYFKIALQAGNESELLLDIEEEGILKLIHGSIEIPFFTNVGGEMKIMFDANDPWKTLQFEGEKSADNNFLASYYQQFRPSKQLRFEAAYLTVEANENIAKNVETRTPKQYLAILEADKKEQLHFLDIEGEKNSISSSILDYLKNDVRYTTEANRLAYVLFTNTNLSAEELVSIKKRMPLSDDVQLNADELVTHPAYLNFLKAYIFYTYMPKDLNSADAYHVIYDLIEDKLSGRGRYHLLTEFVLKVYERTGEIIISQKQFATFREENPYSEYTQLVEKLYGEIDELMEGAAAPDFEFKLENGEVASLDAYKGKVVYVSFWASWCGACLIGYKRSASMRRDLEKMGIVLLNVSLDEKEETWHKTLSNYTIVGTNTLGGDLNYIKKIYNITALPVYHIINKKGQIAYLSDNADRDILQEFRKLLEE